MKKRAEHLQVDTPPKSKLGGAINYLLKYFSELTLFMEHNLSIDNNDQERLLRNPVIGRKTWYGTNSPKGSKTAAILFSLFISNACEYGSVTKFLATFPSLGTKTSTSYWKMTLGLAGTVTD